MVASSAGTPVAAFEDRARRLAGVQYHPEVVHTQYGQEVLRRFLHDIAGIDSTGRPPTSPTAWSHRSGRRSVTRRSSAGSPAASTPRWPQPWSIGLSVTS